jgi:hypothetical protein
VDRNGLVANHRPVATIRYQASGVGRKATKEALQNKNRRGVREVVISLVNRKHFSLSALHAQLLTNILRGRVSFDSFLLMSSHPSINND